MNINKLKGYRRQHIEKLAETSEKRTIKISFWKRIKKICLKLLAIIVALMIFTGSTIGALAYFNIIEVPIISEIFIFFGISKVKTNEEAISANKDTYQDENDIDISNSQYSVEHSDADEYYKNNSDILSVEKASESNTVLTESEACKYLAERGFSNCPITTTYLITGKYIETLEVSEFSSEKHPIYEMVYTTLNGEIWSITIVNNTITAFPINYNSQHNKNIQVMLSETEYMTSYDSVKDKFYKTIPHNDVLLLKMISRIDADTLEKLTFDDIDKL